MNKFPPVAPKVPFILHGGDYNPDQWLSRPDILAEDIRLMKLAGVNCVSLGIFAWAALEPSDGVYEFGWLDRIMDSLYENGIYTILATPSGARPAWLDAKYPTALRVNADRTRNLHGGRHNHCYTSPDFRRKVTDMNTALAKRYANHPGLIMWHVSNEYGGECHCPLCQDAWRAWLRERYHNDINELNEAWWTYFWAHKFTSFEEIESPSPRGESEIHGMNLDWRRFVTHQTQDFIENETAPLRKYTPDIPVTINMMGTYDGLNYWELKNSVDVISWDSYPSWHSDWSSDARLAQSTAFVHDVNRSLLGKPFMLMESTPSLVNWQAVCKLKRPGMHRIASLLAVAHGSDTVQYFQWRKSRGASEKFHGAVVDHEGSENTRVFREVAALGADLKKLTPIVGTTTPADVAIIYDWENNWAINNLQGLNRRRNYYGTCIQFYEYFESRGISADVISSECDLSKYKVVCAPMLYMLRDGVADRLRAFVAAGGRLVTTYLTGYVDKTDLCFLGGFPGAGLRELIGIWAEEIDTLYPSDKQSVAFASGGSFPVTDYCELIHPEGADVLATYESDFYAGQPAATVRRFGDGYAYHIAARTDSAGVGRLLSIVCEGIALERARATCMNPDVRISVRTDGEHDYVFALNFGEAEADVAFDGAARDLLTDKTHTGGIKLGKYGCAVLEMPRS